MNQAEIIAMAKEAGMSNDGLPFVDEWVTDTDGLQRFAALVAAKEREAIAAHYAAQPHVEFFGAELADEIRARASKGEA